MRCDEVEPLIGAWQDGELGPLAAWRVRRHVRTCPTCAAEARSLAGLEEVIRAAAPLGAVSPAAARERGMPRFLPGAGQALPVGVALSFAATAAAMTVVFHSYLLTTAPRGIGGGYARTVASQQSSPQRLALAAAKGRGRADSDVKVASAQMLAPRHHVSEVGIRENPARFAASFRHHSTPFRGGSWIPHVLAGGVLPMPRLPRRERSLPPLTISDEPEEVIEVTARTMTPEEVIAREAERDGLVYVESRPSPAVESAFRLARAGRLPFVPLRVLHEQ